MENVLEGLSLILSWQALVAIVFGALAGVAIGAIPGLTGTMTIALLLPITVYFPPWVGMPMLLGIYKGSNYGGAVSAILIGTPGTPAAAVTVLDGYPLRKQGKAGKALQMAVWSSYLADTFSDLVLIFIAAPLAILSLKFGPTEFTALMAFSLTIVASVAGRSTLKGIIAAALGLLVGTIGMDPIEGIPRLVFGSVNLYGGFPLIPLLIGLFALPEIFSQAEQIFSGKQKETVLEMKIESQDRLTLKEFLACKTTILRSAVIGTFIGILPGIGSAVSPFVSYGAAKRAAKEPEQFGKGALEGVAAAEAANSAVCGANLIPMLSLGIPGDAVAAILLGGFMVHGLNPGPLLFQENATFVYALYAGMLLASMVYLVIGLIGTRLAVKITRIPQEILVPIITVCCVVGAYAFNSSLFDVLVMISFGILGYLMKKFDYSLPAFLIAFILSPMLETSLRQTLLLSDGSFLIFLTRPISLSILIVTIITLIGIIKKEFGKKAVLQEK